MFFYVHMRLHEHIDYLNNYIIQLENKHKEQISDLTIKNTNDLKLNSIKQDTRILELESELNVEKEKNEKLQKKLEEYEQIIKNNKYNIEKLSDEKNYIDNAKKTSEELFGRPAVTMLNILQMLSLCMNYSLLLVCHSLLLSN